jgi:hypothetical protein
MSSPIVRVSVMRVEPSKFALCAQLMTAAEDAVVAGIAGMTGCLEYFSGADEETASITIISLWDSLGGARQMGQLRPLLDLENRFTELGGRVEHSIINCATLRRFETVLRSRTRGGAVP